MLHQVWLCVSRLNLQIAKQFSKFPARFLQMSHGLLFPVLTEKGKIGDTAVTEQYIFNMFMCVIFSFLFPSGPRQVGISSFSVSCSTIQHDNQKIYFGNELVHWR